MYHLELNTKEHTALLPLFIPTVLQLKLPLQPKKECSPYTTIVHEMSVYRSPQIEQTNKVSYDFFYNEFSVLGGIW